VIEDFERCYQAARSRDQRFDGWFFTAVTSTGIYCRPINHWPVSSDGADPVNLDEEAA